MTDALSSQASGEQAKVLVLGIQEADQTGADPGFGQGGVPASEAVSC